MDAPDLQVAALLVDRDLFRDVVIASRAGPDLDNQRKGLVIYLEDIVLVEERNHVGSWNDENIGDEVIRFGTANSPRVNPHPVDRPVKLRDQHVAKLDFQLVMSGRHPRLLTQNPIAQLPFSIRLRQRQPLVGFAANTGLDRHARLPVALRGAPSQSLVYARARMQSVA